MRTQRVYRIRGIGGVSLLAAFALLVILTSPLGAVDQDDDGLDDAVETQGCAANQGSPPPSPLHPVPVGPEVEAFFPACPGSGSVNLVSPSARDVFVIHNAKPDPMDLTNVPIQPNEWLAFVANAQPKLGVHRVMRDPNAFCKCVLAPAGQTGCSDADCTQKALRVEEDNASGLDGSNVIGITPWQGTPNTAGDILVYTKRIAEDIQKTCAGKTCKFTDEAGKDYQLTQPAQWGYLYRQMKKHVIGHESGHTMMLRAQCTTELGCHYPAKTGWLMDASVARKTTGGTVTWTIPHQHNLLDVPKLKEP